MRYKAILFDKDGTLIEADGNWVPFYRSVLMRLKDLDESGADAVMEQAGFDRTTGRTFAGSIMAGGTTKQLVELWWPDLDETGRQAMGRQIDVMASTEIAENVRQIGDVAALFLQLRERGYQVGVATNDSLVSATRQLAQLGVSHLVDAVIAADTVARPKPSGDMIRQFAALAGIDHASIVMVGDNFHDIEEARMGGAGCAIAVLSGNGKHEDLADIADVVFTSIAEIPSYLEEV